MATLDLIRSDPRRYLSNYSTREADALIAQGEQTATDLILTTLTSNGSAFVAGYGMRKFKDKARVMGVPLDAAGGFAGFALAALGLFGEKGSEYVMAGSIGVMNSASGRVGAELCDAHEKKAAEAALAAKAKQAAQAQPAVETVVQTVEPQPEVAASADLSVAEIVQLKSLLAQLQAERKAA